jgi:hypothetical protein
MSVQQKTFIIDGVSYTATQLGAKKGRKIWLKLMQIIAPSLRELGTLKKLDEKAIASALAAAVENLDDATLEELYLVFGETCTVMLPTGNTPNLTDVVFDQHFAGNYLAMTQWLWECIVFNFASFLDGTGPGKMSDLVKRVVSRSESLTASTGSSGGS